MEDGGGEEYIDKSRILNVKPLRCLVPIFPPAQSFPSFPHPQSAPPFKCAPTGGPFQSGFAPFYPYAGYPDTRNVQTPMPYVVNGTIPAVPISSFRSEANGDAGRSSRNPGLSEHEEDGYSDGVHVVDVEDSSKAAPKRKKSVGGSQDVNIARVGGDTEAVGYIRMEMCLIGLHAPVMAGIDYMRLKVSQGEDPVAVSIVSSGGYEDNSEDGDVLVYSGQGGNVNNRGMDITDQKHERGNPALEKSLDRRVGQIFILLVFQFLNFGHDSNDNI
ncbi:hypothetical protein F3Y22_tig00110584pilonHSYRG00427 [Hibiscus syriacus]|uniref:YDG domain-containing protein n=1 Tax=Hibiscus syriacus TaxID=106335 RepID=A0A6A3A6D3_HIBSY|nr:hypothetical protein F3Y22_tig00110584pilonHSYRG00427 [Hibiscus syriacus]